MCPNICRAKVMTVKTVSTWLSPMETKRKLLVFSDEETVPACVPARTNRTLEKTVDIKLSRKSSTEEWK